MVRWSLDKAYLAELERAGVPITPTVFVAAGSYEPTSRTGLRRRSPRSAPAVVDAASYAARPASRARDRLTSRGCTRPVSVVLVQPFLASVATDGERPFGLPRRRLQPRRQQARRPAAGSAPSTTSSPKETNAEHEASAEQVRVAQAACRRVVGSLRQPRRTPASTWSATTPARFCVLEVELVEPSLFLAYAEPAAAERFATVLAR